MYRLWRLGAVLAGYAFALLAAFGACYYRELQFQQAHIDTSGGMYAWGDLIAFSAIFGPLALLPTGLALYFLRRSQKFRTVLSIVSLPLAATGLAALFSIVLVGGRYVQHPVWRDLATLGLLRVYPAPLLFVVFIICAFIAPTRRCRRLLLSAAGIESPAAACAFYFIAWLPVWAMLHRIF